MSVTPNTLPAETAESFAARWAAAPSLTEHPRHEHSLSTIVGYSVVRTWWTTEDLSDIHRVQVEIFPRSNAYGAARARCHALLAVDRREGNRKAYAVVDNLYACGCRSDRAEG